MYDGNIVLLAFFLGMVFGLYAAQVTQTVLPTPERIKTWQKKPK